MSNETKKEECYSCGGKGTYSQIHGISARGDFIGDKDYSEKPSIHNYPCKACDGTGLKQIHNSSPHILTGEENDDPEISEKDFEDMYISQGKNEIDKMERRFNIWLENRDDDFEIDIWDFRCLQDFIFSEIDTHLLSQEKQWKDEMAGKIKEFKKEKIAHFGRETSWEIENKNGYDEGLNKVLSLLSNNQEE